MVRYAHPSGFRTTYFLASVGLSDSVDTALQSDVVTRYLKQCNKRRARIKKLCPECLCIAKKEVRKLEWGDECFENFVMKMFGGADVSQLENFYSRYNRVANKTLFFLNYVRNEL